MQSMRMILNFPHFLFSGSGRDSILFDEDMQTLSAEPEFLYCGLTFFTKWSPALNALFSMKLFLPISGYLKQRHGQKQCSKQRKWIQNEIGELACFLLDFRKHVLLTRDGVNQSGIWIFFKLFDQLTIQLSRSEEH